MPLNPAPITVKDAANADKAMVAFNDGTNNAFAQPVLNADGGLINPATAENQASTNAAIGAPADAAASSDTGTFSLIALVKRGLQNWTTLLARTPVLGAALAAASSPVALATDQLSTLATASNQGTANASLGSIDGKLPSLDNSKVSVIPAMTTGGNISVQTAATGTNWTAFSSQALKQLTVSNQTGTTIEFRQGGSGVGFQIPSGSFYTFFGLTNANQLEARRVDTSNAQVTATARWES